MTYTENDENIRYASSYSAGYQARRGVGIPSTRADSIATALITAVTCHIATGPDRNEQNTMDRGFRDGWKRSEVEMHRAGNSLRRLAPAPYAPNEQIGRSYASAKSHPSDLADLWD